jgi:hypothetical protein
MASALCQTSCVSGDVTWLLVTAQPVTDISYLTGVCMIARASNVRPQRPPLCLCQHIVEGKVVAFPN